MIIWGTKGVESTVETGSFHCPRCGQAKSYTVKKVDRYFTLYFIPLIPLGEAGRYLECNSCAGTFAVEAKDHDPEKQVGELKAEFETAMLRVLVALSMADGNCSEDECELIANIMTRLTDRAYEHDEIFEETMHKNAESIDDVLRNVGPKLNTQGKVIILSSMVLVGQADGNFSSEERNLCFHAGKLLGFRKRDVEQLIETMLQDA